jgi:alpha-glucosidase
MFPSPNADWGFDVSDYRDVHPELGTLADLDALVAAADARGIRVLLDLVPNHTSDEHAWFVEARGARDSPRRDFYVWRDPRPDGGPPNNWLSIFGGPAWELDEGSGQYYLHLFHRKQPDLDWWNDDVRAEFDDILRFWFDRGIAGFRIDVAHGIVKDRELRDNPPAGPDDSHLDRRLGQRPDFSMHRPEVHDVLRRWRALTDELGDPERVLVGETWVLDLERLASFYGTGLDELHLAFNFVFLEAELEAATLAGIVARTEELLPQHAWPVWTLSNHDLTRCPTRWGQGDQRRVRLALMLLLTLRGTPVLYYGDEIGMPETDVPQERVVDPVALLGDDDRAGRDGARTPMPWSAEDGAGFTRAGVEPWLPFGDLAANVADQRDDPASVLNLTRDLIALRRAEAALRTGAYAEIEVAGGLWAFRRGDAATVALNLSGDDAALDGVRGRIAVATDRARHSEAVDGTLALGPWQGAVVLA